MQTPTPSGVLTVVVSCFPRSPALLTLASLPRADQNTRVLSLHRLPPPLHSTQWCSHGPVRGGDASGSSILQRCPHIFRIYWKNHRIFSPGLVLTRTELLSRPVACVCAAPDPPSDRSVIAHIVVLVCTHTEWYWGFNLALPVALLLPATIRVYVLYLYIIYTNISTYFHIYTYSMLLVDLNER